MLFFLFLQSRNRIAYTTTTVVPSALGPLGTSAHLPYTNRFASFEHPSCCFIRELTGTGRVAEVWLNPITD